MDDKLKKVFEGIIENNLWKDDNSLSGTGSNLIQTEVIRKELPKVFLNYNIKTMVDAPCGDFFWMKEIKENLNTKLDKYLGADIVKGLVDKNRTLYSNDKISFEQIDITTQILPKVDLIFSRDCLVHLSFENIYIVIRNFKKSKSKYLLTTTFVNRNVNTDILDGGWRTLDLQSSPFFFPKPILLINENCTEGDGSYNDKCLGLWEIKKLPSYSNTSVFLRKSYHKLRKQLK